MFAVVAVIASCCSDVPNCHDTVYQPSLFLFTVGAFLIFGVAVGLARLLDWLRDRKRSR